MWISLSTVKTSKCINGPRRVQVPFSPISANSIINDYYVLISSLGSQSRLIVYPCSVIRRRRLCRCRRQQFQTSSPLKPLGQSKSNFMWSLLMKGSYINSLDHMTKMAATPIYGKIFSRTKSLMILKLGM